MNDMTKYMTNPTLFTLRKWLSDLIKEKYQKHDNIVERISASLITNSDVSDFGLLITDIYETAYRKAVSDYKDQFEKMGVKINVVMPNQ